MRTNLRVLVAIVALSSLLGLGGCTKWAAKKNPNWREATSGEHLVNLFWTDVQQKNWQALEAHVAPEFLGTNQSMSFNKASLLDHLSHLGVESFQIGEVQTRPAGNDLLVSYVIEFRMRSVSGQNSERRLRMLSVWQELKHGWVVVAMSSSPVS